MNRHQPLSLLEKIPEGMLTLFEQCEIPCGCRDAEGCLVYVNGACLRCFEVGPEENKYLAGSRATHKTMPALDLIAEKLVEYERYVFEAGQRYETTGAVANNGKTRIFLIVKYPLYVGGLIIGTYFYLKNFRNTPG